MESRQPTNFDEFLLELGRLNYAWTNTESLLIHLIAGLSSTDKETATVIFLTLNASRARLDLVERLAKMDRVESAVRDAVLHLTSDLGRLSALRNRYNHCIYSFDQSDGSTRSILMRIADRKDSIKMGKATELDAAAMEEIATATERLSQLNRQIWSAVVKFGFPQ